MAKQEALNYFHECFPGYIDAGELHGLQGLEYVTKLGIRWISLRCVGGSPSWRLLQATSGTTSARATLESEFVKHSSATGRLQVNSSGRQVSRESVPGLQVSKRVPETVSASAVSMSGVGDTDSGTGEARAVSGIIIRKSPQGQG